VRLLEQGGHEQLARSSALIGYSWMGFLFLFLSLMLVFDLLRLVRYLAAFFVRVPAVALFAPRPLFLVCCLIAVLVAGYGWFEALQIRTEHLVIPTDKLPPGSARLRIVQITDLHVGLIVRDGRVGRVVEAIRQAAPDLVVATGDMVDGHVSHFDGISQMFRGLAPPLGMFAVYGNHEYYAGFGQATGFLQRSGFELLRAERRELGEQLSLVGVDDPAAARRGEYRAEDEDRLLATGPPGRFVLLLKHRPVVNPGSRGRFDLQLSGHVHKGQVFPFNGLTWLNFPVRAGLNRLAEGGALYVSRGSGTWGPPIRFLAPPEVTVIDLVPTSTSSAVQYGRSS
jgi:predicted MPP superfamily phosphohydrolase